MRVVSNEDCKRSYGPIIHNSTLCAVGIERGTGTCQVRFDNVSFKLQFIRGHVMWFYKERLGFHHRGRS